VQQRAQRSRVEAVRDGALELRRSDTAGPA
jgi:hypothetical protein